MLILVPKITARLRYIFRLLLTDINGIDVDFTSDTAEFEGFHGEKMSYYLHCDDTLFFDSGSLLFDTGITVQTISYITYKGLPAFFPVYSKKSALPFDVFAASFYLVSRYEEYLPHLRDAHGRFQSSGSEAMRMDFIRKPLVNIWAGYIAETIREKYPDIRIKRQAYKFIPTVDIDSAYFFKYKGFTRSVGGMIRSLQQKDIAGIKERIQVLLGKQKDPYDTYDLQMSLWKKLKLNPVYFILYSGYGHYDRNLPLNSRHFKTLIRSLADYAGVGIHPSYASNSDNQKLKSEIELLGKVLRREVTMSRQHFLKMELPVTYRNLLNNDITDDYTMGYPDVAGFRASICTPFRFYDLDLETETNLVIHPFAVMDGTLVDYMKLTAPRALEIVQQIINEVKNVNGTFILLIHNQTLMDSAEWKDWKNTFIRIIEMAAKPLHN